MPRVRVYKDSSGFWKLAIAFLAIFSAWTWPSSNSPDKSVEPVEICCQARNGHLPGLLVCRTAWLPKEETRAYHCAATGCPCQMEAYYDFFTQIMPNHSIPWPVLFESKEQCPLGTTSSNNSLGAADAFGKCIDLACQENTSPLQKDMTDSTGHTLGVCQFELLGSDVSWMAHSNLPSTYKPMQKPEH